jgi:hypothetical protein
MVLELDLNSTAAQNNLETAQGYHAPNLGQRKKALGTEGKLYLPAKDRLQWKQWHSCRSTRGLET